MDESKAKDYLLVAVFLDTASCHRTRGVVRSLILPGQTRLHMRKESDTRRRIILSALSEASTTTTIFRAPKDGRSDGARRGACVEALVRSAVTVGADLLCFELDETLRRQDRQRIVETLHRTGSGTLDHRHERVAVEPLLALPDAIGWAWAKGGDWRRRCGPVTVENV